MLDVHDRARAIRNLILATRGPAATWNDRIRAFLLDLGFPDAAAVRWEDRGQKTAFAVYGAVMTTCPHRQDEFFAACLALDSSRPPPAEAAP